MLAQIPWNVIGPAAGAAIIILGLVFWFLLKMKKLEKGSPSNPPKDLNTVSKKSLCFKQEGRISSNETAIKMIGDQLKTANENNREDHGKIFTKMDDMREKIIDEIHNQNKKL